MKYTKCPSLSSYERSQRQTPGDVGQNNPWKSTAGGHVYFYQVMCKKNKRIKKKKINF